MGGTWKIPRVLIETLWNVKWTPLTDYELQYTVLIETLWNVKMLLIRVDNELTSSINRNIVECKANIKELIPLCRMVLIETLWNVKQFYQQTPVQGVQY